MSLSTRLQQAAAKNKELLAILSQTDHAVPALAQQQRFIADLQSEVSESNKRVEHSDRRRKKELSEHERFRDSVMRRFAFKATGRKAKFEAQAKKEEEDYFQALQAEHIETEMNKGLKQRLAEALQVARSLEAEVSRHNSAQAQLDQLYNSIFAGSTPEMPEEDEKERLASLASQAYQEARSKAEAEYMAIQLLNDAQRRMSGALASMQEALQASRYDMFSSNSFADMMERNALHRAESEVMAAQMAVVQAQRMSPEVGSLPQVEIDQGHLVRDVFFDNIFTDMKFHEEIKLSEGRVRMAAGVLEGIVAKARERHAVLHGEFERRERELGEARRVLQRVRESAFEAVGEV